MSKRAERTIAGARSPPLRLVPPVPIPKSVLPPIRPRRRTRSMQEKDRAR
jgi:hypothetical protein